MNFEIKCHRCSKIDDRIVRGMWYCAECAKKQRMRQKKLYQQRIEEKCCTRCGRQDTRTKNGKTTCLACAVKDSHRNNEYYYAKKKTARSGNSETVDVK